jgi:hypothetical protein
MNGLLEWLQDTALADWVRVSEWGYPIILTLHSIGLALVVGVILVIDLRILGIPRSMPVKPLRQLMLLVWFGFTINLLTGFALFTADAVKFYESPTFRFKLGAVFMGVTLAVFLNASVLRRASEPPLSATKIPGFAKVLAVASILFWLSAIGLGRYVAYE